MDDFRRFFAESRRFLDEKLDFVAAALCTQKRNHDERRKSAVSMRPLFDIHLLYLFFIFFFAEHNKKTYFFLLLLSMPLSDSLSVCLAI